MPKNSGSPSSESSETHEVVIIGGGPAGLSTALYTTRLNHDTALVDRGGGRSAMMVDTHNVIGVPEETSGNEFLQTARDQLQYYGTEFYRDIATDVSKSQASGYEFEIALNEETLYTDRVVLATGFADKKPDPPLPRTGHGLHYCLHCDGYMFQDEPVYVMGHSNSAAYVAMIMLNFTDSVDLLLRGDEPTWDEHTEKLLHAHPVNIIDEEITGMFKDKEDPAWLGGFEFADGTIREYTGGFALYGSKYNNGLAEGLGCELNDDGTVVVDEHNETTVDGVYAVGDLIPGHNQIPIAMGQGAKAGIAIHKDLRTYPKSLEELSHKTADSTTPAASDD
ncbi:NAD(P)/FAD-dependent oxidoreductase [Salinarchaeum sp. IM2453]|uniref:NAD(P)/FAD-dependent oxidoreductase n=1 Tax=Salinarchaeum sp. IM2453 TaxID=2862870 RepID=UPI001C836C11|nr:NAD(P)/FAD-dependent oxidoreductase [Salinarchaeum sp. IM2453]QZA88258.1 NAD(P)/FAD-dependent oxidoreductase [Salinarchaeum sp. IM2453]